MVGSGGRENGIMSSLVVARRWWLLVEDHLGENFLLGILPTKWWVTRFMNNPISVIIKTIKGIQGTYLFPIKTTPS